MGLALFSLGLAAILGFATHRASICTVRAIAEVLSSGRAYCLVSFAKTVLWVLAVVFLALTFDPALSASISGYSLSYASLFGGLLFGMGAALNGGCSFSTLARLADGQLRMLGTLSGFALGTLLIFEITGVGLLPQPMTSPAWVTALTPFAGAFAIVLCAWAASELRRLWRTRPPDTQTRHLALIRQYRLSTAAALIGSANGLLYLFQGSWTYTGALRQGVEGLVLGGGTPIQSRLSLLVAVFLGMMLSTLQRGSFRLERRMRPSWAMNFVGGTLMGAGVVLVPGGNDALVLYGIPTFSSHAVPAYVAILLGIAIVMLVMRHWLGMKFHVTCQDDLCDSHDRRG